MIYVLSLRGCSRGLDRCSLGLCVYEGVVRLYHGVYVWFLAGLLRLRVETRCNPSRTAIHRSINREPSELTHPDEVAFTDAATLEKLLYIHRQFFDLRGVELLNILQNTDVVVLDKVDRDALPAKASRPSDAVNILLPTRR